MRLNLLKYRYCNGTGHPYRDDVTIQCCDTADCDEPTVETYLSYQLVLDLIESYAKSVPTVDFKPLLLNLTDS